MAVRLRPNYQHIYVSVNSKDRVFGGTENRYTVKLPRLIRNVVSVELLSAEIPNTNYPRDPKYLYYSVTQTDGTYTLLRSMVPAGIYTHDDAAVSMTGTIKGIKTYVPDAKPPSGDTVLKPDDDPDDALSDADTVLIDPESHQPIPKAARFDQTDIHSGQWYVGDHPVPDDTLDSLVNTIKLGLSFKFDKRLGKFYIQTDPTKVTSVMIHTHQTSPELGFEAHLMTPLPVSSTESRYYGIHVAQLYNSSHLWLAIEELASMQYWNVIATHPLPRNVFARIQMATDVLHWVFWSQGIEEFKREASPGSSTSLDQLTISWLDENGQLTDFHGLNHSFMLKITQSPPD